MSQVKDVLKRAVSPDEVKRVLNIRGINVGIDVSSFSGNLSSSDTTVQAALDTIDNLNLGISATLFDANTILAADTDDTPTARTINASEIVGRTSSGNIEGLTASQVLTILGLSDPPVGALIAVIEDQKAQNVDGGTFSSGADRTRDLNTLVYNLDTTVSLSSNQFTLPAGDWEVQWFAPAYRVSLNRAFLYNATGATEVATGMSVHANPSGNNFSISTGITRVSPGSSTAYEIRHRCNTTNATFGFGIAHNFSTEVYTRVIIRQG